MIVSLPECIGATVVCEWLELSSIARLDSAYCVRKDRDPFLSLCTFRSISSLVKCHVSVLKWMMKRRIVAISISIDTCDSLNESLIRQFMVVNGAKLCTIKIDSCDVSVSTAIAQNCNKLSSFNCGQIDCFDLASILKRNASLKSVEVIGISGTNRGLFRDVSLPELKSLKIIVPDRFNGGDCLHTGALVSKAPKLQKLCIEHDSCGPKPTVPIIHTNCLHLRTLCLHQIDKIDENLAQIVVLCSHVVNLQFTFCKNLSDNGILLVAKHLHQLRSLSVLYCNAVTDISVRSLADYRASTLELLHLSAINFTRTALDYARGKCPKLKLQVVGNCTTQYDYKNLHQTSTVTHLNTQCSTFRHSHRQFGLL